MAARQSARRSPAVEREDQRKKAWSGTVVHESHGQTLANSPSTNQKHPGRASDECCQSDVETSFRSLSEGPNGDLAVANSAFFYRVFPMRDSARLCDSFLSS